MTEPIYVGQARDEFDASTIGVVEAVAPKGIDVAIFLEAPHGTGLRQGAIHHFPRINSYIVLPSERGSILAMVTWIGIDEQHFAARIQHDQIGLPVPRRRLKALPLGVLSHSGSLTSGAPSTVALDRGALLFPTVGDPVRLPTKSEAIATLPSYDHERLTVPIGQAPLVANAEVRLDPNRLFGRHLAILGNTGSGKSCSVAQLIRSSVKAIGSEPKAFGAIILDANGEYARAFDDLSHGLSVRRFSVQPRDEDSKQLRVPYWLWNYREWLSFSAASERGQAPLLRRSLGLSRLVGPVDLASGANGIAAGRQLVRQYKIGAIGPKANSECLSGLDNALRACQYIQSQNSTAPKSELATLMTTLKNILKERRGTGEYLWKFGTRTLDSDECATLEPLFDQTLKALGVPLVSSDGLDVNVPTPFQADGLVELLPLVAADSGPEVVGWISPLVERLRISMEDERLTTVCGWTEDESLEEWLNTYLPDNSTSQITIIDLSLVPSQIVHVIVAVFARALLEAMERHHRSDSSGTTPRILVVDEAHTLIRRQRRVLSDDQSISSTRLCREAFERIAREGRKFGLSLVVSSQRPSELSETVLSQCNTFVVHRIVNDNDQGLVRRLVPDNLGSLMDELPALPSQTALVVGWALDIPTLVRITDLAEAHRPRSADPDFVTTWTEGNSSDTDWSAVAADWQQSLVEPGTAEPETTDTVEDRPEESPF